MPVKCFRSVKIVSLANANECRTMFVLVAGVCAVEVRSSGQSVTKNRVSVTISDECIEIVNGKWRVGFVTKLREDYSKQRWKCYRELSARIRSSVNGSESLPRGAQLRLLLVIVYKGSDQQVRSSHVCLTRQNRRRICARTLRFIIV